MTRRIHYQKFPQHLLQQYNKKLIPIYDNGEFVLKLRESAYSKLSCCPIHERDFFLFIEQANQLIGVAQFVEVKVAGKNSKPAKTPK